MLVRKALSAVMRRSRRGPSLAHQRSTVAFLYVVKSTSGGTGQASNGERQAIWWVSPSVHRTQRTAVERSNSLGERRRMFW